MPHLKLIQKAVENVNQALNYYEDYPQTKRKLSAQLRKTFGLLKLNPLMHPPFELDPCFNHGTILFGKSGYDFLYRYQKSTDTIFILGLKHHSQNKSFYDDIVVQMQNTFLEEMDIK